MLDQDKIVEWNACRLSPAYLAKYVSILDTANKQVIPFALWPFQYDVLEAFQTYSLLQILKARQLGITWCIALFALWEATFHEAANVLILSKKEPVAKDLLDKIKFMRASLPSWLQLQTSVDNSTTLVFPAMNSKLQALPSTEDAGRSETASLVICDEWAFHPYAEENYLAFKPTIDAGGRLIGSSTANGRGGFYYDMYQATLAGTNGFHPLFLPWNLRPDRDQEWYEAKKLEYSATQDLRAKFYQEYPATIDEAWASLGSAVFDKEVLDKLQANCRPPIVVEDDLQIWKQPDPTRAYMIGGDPGEGIGQNYSGIAVIDYLTGEHVADLHGQIDPDALARKSCLVGKKYNTALVGIERNNHGHTVLNVMRNYLGYPNIYRHTDVEGTSDKLGFLTSYQSKGNMVEEFKVALHRGDYITYDLDTVNEFRTFSKYVTESKKGEPRVHYLAAQGCYDDRVMKNMIAWQMKHYVVRSGFGQKARVHIGGGI